MDHAKKTSVAAIRKRLGITQAELADRLRRVPLSNIAATLGDVRSISDSRISRWERGEVNPDRLVQAAIDLIAAK